MIDKGTVKMIKGLSNKDLLRTINKIRHEKAHPETYSKKYGTSRWVTESEFFGGHHKVVKDELKRRQEQGKIKQNAGKPKKSTNQQGLGFNLKVPKFNFNGFG